MIIITIVLSYFLIRPKQLKTHVIVIKFESILHFQNTFNYIYNQRIDENTNTNQTY